MEILDVDSCLDDEPVWIDQSSYHGEYTRIGGKPKMTWTEGDSNDMINLGLGEHKHLPGIGIKIYVDDH